MRPLGIRQFQVALRKLRQFTSRLDGPKTELDLDGTIDKTCQNAGRLELVWERPRENSIKVLLADGCRVVPCCPTAVCATSCLLQFTAPPTSRTCGSFTFHNCIYDWLYHSSECRRNDYTDTTYLLNNLSTDYRVIIVGDASMAPSELMRQGGVIDWDLYNDRPGLEWLRDLRRRFEYSVWLNPIPSKYWDWVEGAYTIKKINEIFPMHELTIDGLEQAISALRSRQGLARAT
jgi:uncharacterized protein with von Willebrand factor type A (vWA) domain